MFRAVENLEGSTLRLYHMAGFLVLNALLSCNHLFINTESVLVHYDELKSLCQEPILETFWL